MTGRRLMITTFQRRNDKAPANNMNWQAWLDGMVGGDPIGYGPSEGDAVADLYHQIEARELDSTELDPDL